MTGRPFLISPVDVLAGSVRSAMRPPALTCGPDTPCAAVVAGMGDADAALAVVVDGGRRVVGVVSERDVTRRVAFRAAPESPVSRVMTAPALTIPADDRLYVAVVRMRRARLERAPVVDPGGRLVGVLGLQDAVGALAGGVMRHLDQLVVEPSLPGMRAAKEGQAYLARALLDEAVPALEVLRFFSHINDEIYRRVVERAVAAMAEDGWGAVPRPFATIVMGSSGRGESLLRPDQDNGFVIAAYPDEEHNSVDRFFLELGQRMTRDLDVIGFPYCNGDVMATNPLWRKTLPQWCHQIDDWGRKRHAVALLYADIFYDFRAVQGAEELGRALRAHAMAVADRSRDFLRDLSQNESHHMVGLGWFHRFVTDPEEGPHQGEINLKRNGTLPIVEAVRLYALREGVAATATVDRVAALADRGVFSRDDREAVEAAYAHVISLLLRQQVADALAGRVPSSYVPPDALSRRDRDVLADFMKVVERLGSRVRADFTGSIL